MPFTSFNAFVVPVLLGLLAYRALTRFDIPNVWALAIVGLAACCLWTFYRLCLYPRHLTPFRHLPTPERWSCIYGNYFDLSEHVSVAGVRLAQPFQKQDLVRGYLPLNIEVLIPMSARAYTDLFCTRSRDFSQPRVVDIVMGVWGIGGLITANGSKHNTHRRFLSKSQTAHNVRKFHPIILEEAVRMADALVQARTADDQVCVSGIGLHTAISITCRTTMGYHYDPTVSGCNLQVAYERVRKDTPFVALVWSCCCTLALPHKAARWLRGAHIVEPRHLAEQIVEAKRRELQDGAIAENDGPVDIVSAMMESGTFTMDEMVDETMTFLGAGSNSITTGLDWAVYSLCRYPDIQTRVRNEVRQHTSSPNVNERDQAAIANAIDTLPYLRAFCNEVFRHYPPLSAFIREAACDTALAGVPVPKGTRVAVCPAVPNHNPEFWGDDAAEFNPDRWSRDPNMTLNHPGFQTFAQGPRSCIGQRYSRTVLAIFVAVLVGRFEMQLADPEKEVEIVCGLGPIPKDDMVVRLRILEDW